MSLFSQMGESVASLFEASRLRLDDVDFENRGEIVPHLNAILPDLILAAESTGGIGGAKRVAVLYAVGQWVDQVVAPRDRPSLPGWLAEPALRRFLIAQAGIGLDLAVAVMRRYGLLEKVSP